MDFVYGFLGVIAIGYVCVLWFIAPLVAEVYSLIADTLGAGLKWLACRVQDGAQFLWIAGMRLENDRKMRRIS
jgi:hypothetical protein